MRYQSNRLVIYGSRDLNPTNEWILARIDKYFGEGWINTVTEIVSGGAKGVDTAAIDFAGWRGIPVKVFKPDWVKYRKVAGLLRNEEMARYTDYGLGFWANNSPGTANMCAWLESLDKLHFLERV